MLELKQKIISILEMHETEFSSALRSDMGIPQHEYDSIAEEIIKMYDAEVVEIHGRKLIRK